METLNELRSRLDQIDTELVRMLAQRFSVIPRIAELKKKENIKRYHPVREREILEKKMELGRTYQLDDAFIKDIFLRIFEESHKVQKKIIEE